VEDERLRVPRTWKMSGLGALLGHSIEFLWLSG
jgi:hypothetical protein